MILFCYGDFCSEDYDEVCNYISANGIYMGEEGLLKIIENEIITVDTNE